MKLDVFNSVIRSVFVENKKRMRIFDDDDIQHIGRASKINSK